MNEWDFRDLLEERAEGIVRDIRGDLEADGRAGEFDFGYECPIRQVPENLRYLIGGEEFVGMVYMGDLGRWLFVPDGENGIMDYLVAKDIRRLFAPVYDLY